MAARQTRAFPGRTQALLPLIRRLSAVTLSAVAGACGTLSIERTPGDATNPYAAHDGARIVSSPNDTRAYRAVTLPNRLRMLLISDPETDKAAASLVVARGSFHEPAETAGLAHFLEHMLFIGTEKYPDVDDYQQFVSKHGGSTNAYTALDHTNYFFDIRPEEFRGAMDRFAQFFISPLFAAEYVEREKNAVHSEYQLQTKDAGWRAYAAGKRALNPAHPGSRFTIGSLATLDDGVRDELLRWFADNYSADQMYLVALGNESLDELEAWITPLFDEIPDRNIGEPAAMPPMYRAADLPATLVRETLKDRYAVDFQFLVPAMRDWYHSKPAYYLTNLLGHEGPGSLHQWLKAQGWIETLRSQASDFDDRSGVISVAMDLTPAGAEKLPEITRALFDYLDVLRTAGPQRALFDEQAALLKLGFRFQESVTPSRLVTGLSARLLQVPAAELLQAPYLMDRYDPVLITRYLDALTIDNLLLEISGPEQDTDAVEPWFQVPYRLTRAPVTMAAGAVAADFRVPEENPFLPERLNLIAAAGATEPVKVIDRDGIKLWQAKDIRFGTPKANLLLRFGIDGGLTDAEDLVLAQIYASLVQEALNEYAYPAYLAGLSYRLSGTTSGFELSVNGYDDKQVQLLERVLEQFAKLEPDPERFELIRDRLQRSWSSFRTEKPYTQTLTALGNLVQASSFPPATLADSAQTLTLDDLNRWLAEHRSRLTVQGLIHGNIRPDRANAIAGALEAALSPAAHDVYEPAIFSPEAASRLQVNVDHPDASMILYLQDQDSTLSSRASSLLSAQLLRQAYFTELRTKDQLGYVVGISSRSFGDRGGIAFIVQSPVADPGALVERTYRFLDEQPASVAAMSTETFNAYKQGLIADLLETPKNLAEQTKRYWADLKLGRLDFNTRAQLVAELELIDQASAVSALRSLRTALPERQLVIYNKGKFENGPTMGKALKDFRALDPRG